MDDDQFLPGQLIFFFPRQDQLACRSEELNHTEVEQTTDGGPGHRRWLAFTAHSSSSIEFSFRCTPARQILVDASSLRSAPALAPDGSGTRRAP
jgi:hypothetical protein